MFRIIEFISARLIDDWRSQLPRLWSIRIALFWGGVSGLFVVWPAFASAVPLPVFAGLSVLMSVGLVFARITKQKGPDDE